MRRDGLNDAEGRVMDALVAAFEAYGRLPMQHESELGEFIAAIHRCQDQMAVRVARRAFPAGWPMRGAS